MLNDPMGVDRLEAIKSRAVISQDPDICALIRERDRLDAIYGRTLAERDHWKWEATRKISLRKELADLLGTEDIGQAVQMVKDLQARVSSRCPSTEEGPMSPTPATGSAGLCVGPC